MSVRGEKYPVPGGAVATRVGEYLETEKQRSFSHDFIDGWETYEMWDTVEVGVERISPHRFVVTEEDVLSFNRSLGETDPLMVDPAHARVNAPDGKLVAHPLIIVPIAFYASVDGYGTWIRTPGARNPGQRIEFLDPIRVGDEISSHLTTVDRWVRRGNHYITNLHELHATDRIVARWWVTLILPPNREAVGAYAEA